MKYYIKDDFYFEVTNGGASTGTEYGYVTITFEKDGDEHEIRFDIYQVAGGSETIDFIEIEDLVVAKELGIPVAEKDRLDENDELYQIIFDAYDSRGSRIDEEGEYNGMTYKIDDVSAEGVIEEGWLHISLKKVGQKGDLDLSFDIRQDSDGNFEATLNSDEDEAKCREWGIEYDEDFESEILAAYDRYTAEQRMPYFDSFGSKSLNHLMLFEEFSIKDINSLIVGKKYKITWPNYDDYDEGLEPETQIVEIIGKNKADGYLFKDIENDITFSKHPSFLQDCEIEMIEEKVKAQRYKGHKIPGKYLTKNPGKMKKEIDRFRGKKEYKKDWDADYSSGKGGVGKRVKTKKSAATKAYQRMFGNKEK